MNPPQNYEQLEQRLGRIHLNQRLGIQQDYVVKIFGRGRNLFHIENWYSIHGVIRGVLRAVGMYGRGRRNLSDLQIRHNEVDLPHLPPSFNDYSILQLSDLHLGEHPSVVEAMIERLDEVNYDLCVITGDYRYRTYGSIDNAMKAMAELRPHIKTPVYGILGNHDFVEMVPELEGMGVTMLMNESATIERDGEKLYLAGVDDPHYYEVDNLEKAARDIPAEAVSILLSHSPEIYKLAAHAGFDLFLCGHTHGGQICLPGGVGLMYNAHCPRSLGKGSWQYHGMQGYTSCGSGAVVVDVRFNCPPEITLHHLRATGAKKNNL